MSSRPSPQIELSKKFFIFLEFLIIDLCNYSANSLFEIFSFAISQLEVPLSKNL